AATACGTDLDAWKDRDVSGQADATASGTDLDAWKDRDVGGQADTDFYPLDALVVVVKPTLHPLNDLLVAAKPAA
ncbi:MAG TPA: hypothetical protein VFT26_06795, partial [Pyrinomonadaceae bacterium]|nr:hypothetical protein [Pyrinomonadaceae bacterium]